ncbi:hypothetical protein E3N88_00934 [Mikania micrantha]|uniref:Uncharacterized protein n=1 Tax=Mikania micrantha TaxID=192012 RepID=A0A5N6Q1U9_9ASTR|nr:hypothetical protein E3N88_00934 [Mikania micrantha]
MCGEATKAMFPNMFPLDPKEEPAAPPSSPSLDNMPISSVIKIKKGKKTTRKQQSTDPDPDPERQSKADKRRKEPSTTEDAGPQPTATTDAAVGSNVEDEQARDQRSQATAQYRPRFRRRKSIARRKQRTYAISSDSELEDLYGLKHHHTYIPIVKWSFNALHKVFTLTQFNGGIKVLDLTQLMVLAEPFIFDLERLPLENPDNGLDGRVTIKWVKARAQYQRLHRQTAFERKEFLFGSNIASEGHKELKANSFRRLTASEDSLLHQRQRQRLPPLTKTVADYFHSTKGTDTRHAGLSKNKDNVPIVRHNTLLPFLNIKCKRSYEALKINNIKCLLYLASLLLSQCLYL